MPTEGNPPLGVHSPFSKKESPPIASAPLTSKLRADDKRIKELEEHLSQSAAELERAKAELAKQAGESRQVESGLRGQLEVATAAKQAEVAHKRQRGDVAVTNAMLRGGFSRPTLLGSAAWARSTTKCCKPLNLFSARTA